jgi:K+/H+ antiporter YhaU regulatory subunit KhtT
MGVKRGGAAGAFIFNPSARERLDAGDSLVVLGTPEQRERLATLLAETEVPAGGGATSK